MHYLRLYLFTAVIVFLWQCSSGIKVSSPTQAQHSKPPMNDSTTDFSKLSDDDWKTRLTPEEYRVLRQKGTERPFSSEFETLWDSGTYVCKGCGTELFHSSTKFDAGCGWPSFYQGITKDRIREIVDYSHGMIRTEVVCSKCGGHLGHVFNDGYGQPTGLRYCINGISLGFVKKEH